MKNPARDMAGGDSAARESWMRRETVSLLPLRQMAYKLFAGLFLYPERGRLERIQSAAGEILSSTVWQGYPFSSSLENLLNGIADLALEEERRAIVNEYNRLFLIRPKAPPHETYYTDTDGQFRGLMTADLVDEYRQAGLMTSPELNELPDHVSVEMEFLYFLCNQELQALAAGRVQDAERYRQSQCAFLEAHLARWFPKLVRRVKDAQPEHLYHLVLQAAYDFLLHELNYLGTPG